jgi:methionyl-tRNA formyltransferase
MDEGMDTGDILLSQRVPIGPDDTSGSLHRRMSEAGAELLIRTLSKLNSETFLGTPQDESEATYAPLLKKKDGLIDWTKDAKSLAAFIRGMNPWPGAFTFLSGKRLKVLRAENLQNASREKPGTVIEGFPGDLNVAAGRGVLSLKEVQLESAKRLQVKDFLRGCPVSPGTILG